MQALSHDPISLYENSQPRFGDRVRHGKHPVASQLAASYWPSEVVELVVKTKETICAVARAYRRGQCHGVGVLLGLRQRDWNPGGPVGFG